MTTFQLVRRLAQLSPRTKFWVMIGGDALFLPLCMLASVAFRLGSLEAALQTAPLVQVTLALLTLPVLGVPVESSMLRGVDSLLSIVQMPGGIPVATFAIGPAGAKNAALFAAAMLGRERPSTWEALERFRAAQTESVRKSADPRVPE